MRISLLSLPASFFSALFLIWASSVSAVLPVVDSQQQPLPTLAPMLEKAVPAVVNIVTATHIEVKQNPLLSDPFFRYFFDIPQQPQQSKRRTEQSLGSGVVIDAKRGLIITNNHVIANADEISVNLSTGETLQAKLLGTDPGTDVALIQVPADGLTALPLADSDQLRVGDFVIAIGNPFGLGQTVTSGIVSALGRSGLGIEGYEDFIQTDASINPGNSGGALVNLRGELVGINTAILSQSGGNVGIGFAIPINMARDIAKQLFETGQVRRGHLGASAQDVTAELAQAFGMKNQRGALVTQVTGGSPADRAGLQVGDIITEVNGRKIRRSFDIRTRIGMLQLGEKVHLKVVREGRVLNLSATVEEPKLTTVDGAKIHPNLAGATLAQIVEKTPRGDLELVAVVDIKPYSAAAKAGLEKGDVIIQANRQITQSIKALAKAANGRRQLLLNIQRGELAFFIIIQ
ncbi:MAG: Do family serine endopeptidase [Gammaproteobacteria bacterium]|nr:Do family serine endopeptidase [Gammaproteobacteria bacterium]